jgi:hypothetical protein
MTQSLSNGEQCTRPGKLVLHMRLAGNAPKKSLVEVHATCRPATSVVSIARMP